MLGLHLPSPSKAVLVAVASAMLSLGATASYADDAQEIAIARDGVHVTAPHSARAYYAQPKTNESTECVGGYRWEQQHIDPEHETEGMAALPLPCR